MQKVIKQKLHAVIGEILSSPTSMVFSEFSNEMIQLQGKGLRAELCIGCGQAAGADETTRFAAGETGRIIGAAYQCIDDLFDLLPDSTETGESESGSNIRSRSRCSPRSRTVCLSVFLL
jgi:geranylgeranyl pyrophosphate synthase